MAEPTLTVRLSVSTKLGEITVDERTLSQGNGALIGDRHVKLVADAEAAGHTWVMEVLDPDQDNLPIMRLSNDSSKVDDPIPMDMTDPGSLAIGRALASSIAAQRLGL